MTDIQSKVPHNQSLLLASPILVVSDDETHTFMVCRMLEWAGYANFTVADKPGDALSLYMRLDPDLVLLDLAMPGMGGGSLLTQFRDKSEGAVLSLLAFTGPISHEAKAAALRAGVSDFLAKPGDSNEVLVRVSNFLQMRHLRRRLRDDALSLEECIRLRTEESDRAYREMADRLANAAEYRGDASGGHTRRVGQLSAQMAAAMGLSESDVELIRIAAPLHDIGNVGVSDAILLKAGPLDTRERQDMQKHTLVGGELLASGRSPAIQMAEKIALTHHERWDGLGYPLGLKREEIPLAGRIVAVADVFDALINDRPYKRSWALDEAAFEVERLAGTHFDPAVVRAFKNVLAERVAA